MKKKNTKIIVLVLSVLCVLIGCWFVGRKFVANQDSVKASNITGSPMPTEKPTESITPTERPTESPTPTEKPTESITPTERPTESPTPTKKPTDSPTPTEKPAKSPTSTDTVTITLVPTQKPTPTLAPHLTLTPAPTPTLTPTPMLTSTPTITPMPTKEPLPEKNPEVQDTVIKSQNACYEEWLAAGMIVAVSMYYVDFEFDGIYLASETDLSNAMDSKGVYIIMTYGGEKCVIYSKPLSEERTEAGTIDLYTMDLGFATFDTIRADQVNIEHLKEVKMEALSELISQSMLVSLYEH